MLQRSVVMSASPGFTANALLFSQERAADTQLRANETRFRYDAEARNWVRVQDQSLWEALVAVEVCGGLARAVGASGPNMALLVLTLQRKDVQAFDHGQGYHHLPLPWPFCSPLYIGEVAMVAIVVERDASTVSATMTPRCAVGVSLRKLKALVRKWPHEEVQQSVQCHISNAFPPPLAHLVKYASTDVTFRKQRVLSETSPLMDLEERRAEDEDDEDEDDNDSDDALVAGQANAGIDTDAPLGSVTREGTVRGAAPVRGGSTRAAAHRAAIEAALDAEIRVWFVGLGEPDVAGDSALARLETLICRTDGRDAADDDRSDAHTVASAAMSTYGPDGDIGPDGLAPSDDDVSEADGMDSDDGITYGSEEEDLEVDGEDQEEDDDDDAEDDDDADEDEDEDNVGVRAAGYVSDSGAEDGNNDEDVDDDDEDYDDDAPLKRGRMTRSSREITKRSAHMRAKSSSRTRARPHAKKANYEFEHREEDDEEDDEDIDDED